METKNKWLLNAIKIGLDICWYLNFIAMGLTLFTFIKHAIVSNTHMLVVPIDLNTTLERYYPTFIEKGASITTQIHSASLTIINQNPLAELPMILSYLINNLLAIAVLYNLRKVFGTFYRNEPFRYENVARLKKAALYIALFLPLRLINAAVNYLVLRNYTSKFSLDLMPHGIWGSLGIAAVIYIAAEVIRYGFELKKENEAFV